MSIDLLSEIPMPAVLEFFLGVAALNDTRAASSIAPAAKGGAAAAIVKYRGSSVCSVWNRYQGGEAGEVAANFSSF